MKLAFLSTLAIPEEQRRRWLCTLLQTAICGGSTTPSDEHLAKSQTTVRVKDA
jgi:hypothetical protein